MTSPNTCKMMANQRNSQTDSDQPMIYQIRLQGHLGQQWAEWLGGLNITLAENGDTLLTGPVVDQAALYEALRDRHIAGAALDVTDPEPLPRDSPLLQLDNLVIAPHIASASRETREMMAWMAAQNLIAGLKGERLPNCVNPEVYA